MNKRTKNSIREPIVEGIFYPSNKPDLIHIIDTFISDKKKGKSSIIISPHAAYDTVGQQMADAFLSAADRGDIEEIVIISPVHREEKEKIILPSSSIFRTVAGDLEINMKSLHFFKGDDQLIIKDEIPHIEEHSIEDQLPFISHLFGDVKILPILLGKTTITMVKKLTKALNRAYGNRLDKVLFVITSNLSSYEKKENALAKADEALKLFKNGNWREICEQKRTGLIDACGAGALAAVLALFEKKFEINIISRSESVGKESEKGKLVSYGAISFMQP